MAGTDASIGQIAGFIGNNFTNYVFGDIILAGMFLLVVILYFMLKAGVSLDSALVIFIFAVITLISSALLPAVVIWIVIFAVAVIIFVAFMRIIG